MNMYHRRNELYRRFAGAILPVVALLVFVAQIALGAPLKIVIIHTSDMHGHIGEVPDPLSASESKPLVGGFPTLRSLIDNVRLEALKDGALPLLFDSGDYFQGTPVVDETRGSCMIDLMNQLRYTAAAVGNHDFDYGIERLQETLREARFPIVCANTRFEKTGALLPPLRSSILIPWKGRLVGVVGVNTPNMANMTFEENIRGLAFPEPAKILPAEIAKLRARGAEVVILLSHLGIDDDRKLLPTIEGIDLVLGGHSHTTLSQIEYLGERKIPLVHSGADLRTASRVDLELVDGTVSAKLSPLVLFKDLYGQEDSVKASTHQYLERVRHKVEEVLGYSQVDLVRGIIGGDSPLANFVADAMREGTGADFAFANIGGVRYPINKGPISYEQLFLLQPFNNTVDILTMTGDQVRDLVERSLSDQFTPVNAEDLKYAIENFRLHAEGLKREFHGKYGYLIPGNLIVKFDPNLPPMKRVVQLSDGSGRFLEPEKPYKVAFNNFMTMGGDGYGYLRAFKPRVSTGHLVRDLVVQKVRTAQVIKAVPEPRMLNSRLTVRPAQP